MFMSHQDTVMMYVRGRISGAAAITPHKHTAHAHAHAHAHVHLHTHPPRTRLLALPARYRLRSSHLCVQLPTRIIMETDRIDDAHLPGLPPGGDAARLSDQAPLQGLATTDVARLRATHGWNEVPEDVQPYWKLVAKQFIAPMPVMIEVACVLALVVGAHEELGIVLFMLLANAVVGFHEEYKSSQAVRALANRLQPRVTAKRDGTFVHLPARQLVPGDATVTSRPDLNHAPVCVVWC